MAPSDVCTGRGTPRSRKMSPWNIIRLPNPTRLAATLDEGRMLAHVRHRNVVTVYGGHRIDDEVGFWMELIQGRPTGNRPREGPMGPEEALSSASASARRWRPSMRRVFSTATSRRTTSCARRVGGIVLMDFGTGRELGPTHEADFAGTPAYMAPEVLNGQDASVQSESVQRRRAALSRGDRRLSGDGQVGCRSRARAPARAAAAAVGRSSPNLPPGFMRVVERALSPAASSRPASADEMTRELASVLCRCRPPRRRASSRLWSRRAWSGRHLGHPPDTPEPPPSSAQRVLQDDGDTWR